MRLRQPGLEDEDRALNRTERVGRLNFGRWSSRRWETHVKVQSRFTLSGLMVATTGIALCFAALEVITGGVLSTAILNHRSRPMLHSLANP